MFSDCDLEFVKESAYEVRQANHHDVTLHSGLTGHDWVIVTNYASPDCYLLHKAQRGSASPPPARSVRFPHGGAQVHRRPRELGRIEKRKMHYVTGGGVVS